VRHRGELIKRLGALWHGSKWFPEVGRLPHRSWPSCHTSFIEPFPDAIVDVFLIPTQTFEYAGGQCETFITVGIQMHQEVLGAVELDASPVIELAVVAVQGVPWQGEKNEETSILCSPRPSVSLLDPGFMFLVTAPFL
jgi:hypothetical protein